MYYFIGKHFFRFIYHVLFFVEIIGEENIPTEGRVMICSNHISNLDPPLVGSTMRRRVNFMAKEELFRNRIAAFILRKVGAFPVKRGAADTSAIRTGIKILEEENVLVVFPEGLS